jgi:uncharacterized protein YcbX
MIDAGGLLFSGIDHGPLCLVHARYDPETELLALEFPDGSVVEGAAVAEGDEIDTNFYGRQVLGRVVEGPFAEALSRYVGKPLRLVRPDRPGDACDVQVVTLLSEASVEEISRQAGQNEPTDARRFRMLVQLDGCRAHQEDEWEGQRLRLGEARVRVGGPVPRCATTTKSPDTGKRDFDTLKTIKSYRGVRDGRYLDFGVYAEVETAGRVRVGDQADLEEN